MVQIVGKSGELLRPVSLGEALGNRFQVLNGLKAGEKTVIRGNERLRPGQAVRPKRVSAGGPAQQG